MKTILVPTDFSRNARNAVRYALELSQALKTRLVLYHVYQVPMPVSEVPMVLLPDYEIERINLQRMKSLVRDVRKKAGPEVEVEGLVGNGTTVSRLNEYIEENLVDLVVMGTRGANTMLDRLIGTNTAALMKKASCPVLAIPAKARFKGFKEIIYASDHSNQEAVFSSFLLKLAKLYAADLVVLNVKKDHQTNVGNEIEVPIAIRNHYPYDRFHFVSVVDDSIEQGITDFVKRSKPQLLAVTIRQRGAIEDLFHRSVIKQLAYHLPVPLLTLPEEDLTERLARVELENENLSELIL
jgi:nucleotide-binding universal stress UspA family protein